MPTIAGIFMLINVKMPTGVVGILTFISMINMTSGCLKARKVFTFQYFKVYAGLRVCSENYFLIISQPKHMLWVLKRTLSMRQCEFL